MKKLNIIAITVSVVALVVAAGVYFQSPQPVTPPVGAIPGTEVSGPEFCVGGVCTLNYTIGLNKASTTVCSVYPHATSTLRSASIVIRTGTSTTVVFDIAKSANAVRDANPTATTTGFLATAGVSLTGGLQGTIVASTSVNGTSDTGLDGRLVFGPHDALVFKYGGEIGSQNVFVGACKATFLKN